jgi:hypothetical protein
MDDSCRLFLLYVMAYIIALGKASTTGCRTGCRAN